MNKKIKIVFIISGLTMGGAETMLLRILQKIDRSKFSPYVICLTNSGDIGPIIGNIGIELFCLNMKRGKFSITAFYSLIILLRKIKPQVIHSWMYHSDLIGGIAGKISRIPKIIWGVRSSDFIHSNIPYSTRIILYLSSKFSKIIPDIVLYNSKKGLEHHRDIGYREKISYLVPNGVDLSVFKKDRNSYIGIRHELGIPSNSTVIGMVGRYDHIKNHIGFIEAAFQLHKVMPSVHFLMVGRGVDLNNRELRAKLEGSDVKKQFHLLGSRTDMPRIMASLDILTLTSWSEAFPNVLIEAMACEVQCVATNVGDASWILEEVGSIVNVGDMGQLTCEWINALKLDGRLRNSRGASMRARAAKYFEINAMVKKYEEIYLGKL